MTDPFALDTRDRLPDALRVLLEDFPREDWEADPHFEGLVRFWVERHLMFRRLTALLAEDGERLLDRAIDERAYGQRLARLGSTLVGDLHGHHRIEDAHYFPVLARTEPRLARGFEILERDHQSLDHHLADFTDAANGLLGLVREGQSIREAGPGFLWHLAGLERLLERHLLDEEELVVPVVLKHGERGLG
jgi:iron-sulfur cluster repair protein YtfE (RIC family)